jgi:hypothetical protein
MRLISALAIACAIVCPATTFAQEQQQIPAPTVFSLRSGETLPLRFHTSVTNDCSLLFQSAEKIDVLEGPPEINLDFKPGPGEVHITSSGKICPKQVKGIWISISAKDVTEPKEAKLTFRVHFTARNRPWTWTYRYHLLLCSASG